ncbi:MAG: nucleotidyltransferase family protein, partial [Oscillospiraceae bacterium]|nr:nucleotidyltransferase family protein [Oscillospiraceae bacterium]
MHIAGIVAEYNPFHNGHAYHLQKTRAMGADAVVAVMSGNFVQRGEAAILSKWARAEAAVRCGVDLVLELPLYWAASGAQNFAFGAVSTLSHLGCVQSLSF